MLPGAPGSYLALNTEPSSFPGSDVRGTAGHGVEESFSDEAAAGNGKTWTLCRKIHADKGGGTL